MNRRIVRTKPSSSTKRKKKNPKALQAIVIKKNKRKQRKENVPEKQVVLFDTRPFAPLPGFRQRLGRLLSVWALLLPTIPLCLALCYLVSMRLSVVKLGYELAKQTRIQEELLQKNRELRVETSSLRAPPRVAEAAAKEFQMYVPEPARVIVLDPGGKEIPPLPTPSSDFSEFSTGHLVE